MTTAIMEQIQRGPPRAASLPRDFLSRWSANGVWIPVAVIALLVSPLVLTGRTFGSDWTIHEWLLWREELNIHSGGLPGLFVSSTAQGPFPLGVFYPIFALTGSTLYAFGGYLAIVLGDRPVDAYVLLHIVAFVIGFGGMTWLSRLSGIRGAWAQVPGVAFVTGTYYLTDVYGRGDFPEFFATSMLPTVIASTYVLWRSPRLQGRHVLAFVVTMVFLTGSHNLTVLWGSTFLGLLTLIGVLSGVLQARVFRWRRVTQIVAFGALAVGVNAWFLIPDITYGLNTMVAKMDRTSSAVLGGFNSLKQLFDPVFVSGSLGSQIHVQVPWLWFALSVGACVLAWRACHNSRLRRLIIGLTILISCYFTLAVDQSLWHFLPTIYYNTQFTWRLQMYVLLGTALLLIVATRFVDSVPNRVIRNGWLVVSMTIAVFSTAVGVGQAWDTKNVLLVPGSFKAFPGGRNLVLSSQALGPPSLYSPEQYHDMSPRFVNVSAGRKLTIPPAEVHGSVFDGFVEPPVGYAPFATNIATSRHFIDVQGLRVEGRTSDGFLVAARPLVAPRSGSIRISIRTARSAPIVLGKAISFVALAVLALVAMVFVAGNALRSQWRRRRGDVVQRRR